MSRMTIWRGSTASPTTLDDAVLYAPRTSSITQTRGSGSPTFIRATTETGQRWDEAGYLYFTALAGEMVFKGARRVRNWIQAPTENWSSAGWVKSGISVSGNRLTATGANGIIYDNAASAMGAGKTAVGSITLSRVTGTGDIQISTNGGATYQTVLANGSRVSVVSTGSNNGQFVLKIVTNGDAVDATYPQLEDVTGQTTQTASEYVSVGALIHNSQDPNFLSLPGTAGHYASTPDSVANRITGSFDFIVNGALGSLATYGALLSKWNNLAAQSSYLLVKSSDTFILFYSIAGVQYSATSDSLSAAGIAAGTRYLFKVSRNATTGDIDFSYSANSGSSYTAIGATVAGTAGTLTASTVQVEIGSQAAGVGPLGGRIYQAKIYNGIDGTLAVDFNPHRDATTPTSTITSSTTGEVWTLNGASSVVRSQCYHGSMVDGVKCYDTDRSGNPISTSGSYPLVGYVPWEARTNLCLQSQTLGTTWATDASTSVTADQYVAPDGTTTMDKVTSLAVTSQHYLKQGITFSAGVTTYSFYLRYVNNQWCALVMSNGGGLLAASFDLLNGVVGALGAGTTSTIQATAIADVYRVSITGTMSAGAGYLFISPNSTDTASLQNYTAAGTETVGAWGAQVELGSSASTYIPTTTIAVARNADVEAVTTSGAILAVGGTISLTYIPYHSPVGTIALWGTYVDASNYTAILHDATNLIFRKRIAGVNYDATIANAFTSGTTYKMAASWGASGSTIYLNGVSGTPHANTTAAQIAATMQFGADGNSLQQPGAAVIKNYIWQRQLSGSEQAAITA